MFQIGMICYPLGFMATGLFWKRQVSLEMNSVKMIENAGEASGSTNSTLGSTNWSNWSQ